MVHKFDIAGGRVAYRSAKLNRGTEATIRRTGQLPELEGGTFAQPPAAGLMGRALSGMKLWETAPRVTVGDAVARTQCNLITTMQGKLVRTAHH